MAKEKSTKKKSEHDSKSLRQLNADALKKQLLELSKDQFKLRMQKGAGAVIKPHLVKQTRRSIAKIKTILTEKNNAQVKGV